MSTRKHLTQPDGTAPAARGDTQPASTDTGKACNRKARGKAPKPPAEAEICCDMLRDFEAENTRPANDDGACDDVENEKCETYFALSGANPHMTDDELETMLAMMDPTAMLDDDVFASMPDFDVTPPPQRRKGRAPRPAGWAANHRIARTMMKDHCEACGRRDKLHAHHVDFNPSNNDPGNVQSLCVYCHGFWHVAQKWRGGAGVRMPALFEGENFHGDPP